jgi:DNA-binding transcriptional LysR family regulator
MATVVDVHRVGELTEAAGGEGVALGWETLIDEFPKSRRLVKILPNSFVTGRGFYLVRPPAAQNSGEVSRLADSLLRSR